MKNTLPVLPFAYCCKWGALCISVYLICVLALFDLMGDTALFSMSFWTLTFVACSYNLWFPTLAPCLYVSQLKRQAAKIRKKITIPHLEAVYRESCRADDLQGLLDQGRFAPADRKRVSKLIRVENELRRFEEVPADEATTGSKKQSSA